ncbi:MAG: glycosyltransferase [Robiginitalea sp.]
MEAPPDHKKMLVIGHHWPQPDATAAGQRMWQLLQGFSEAGYRITFGSAAAPEKHSRPLDSLGIESLPLKLNDSSFDRWLKGSRFDLVLFDRFLTEEQFSWRVRDQLPGCTLLLDTEDLHSLRHSRETATKASQPWQVSDWLESPLFYRELASILRCDLSLIISRAEQDLLLARLPFLRGKLHYLPFQFPREEASPVGSFSERTGFVFLGNGKHQPNLDAISWLRSEIWPGIRARVPGTRLTVYGAYLPAAVRELHAPAEGFEVLGWAPELKSVLANSRLQLAPLRFGAGVKGKILNALRFGLPTVSTGIGWEGIYEGDESVDFLAETPEEFVRKAVLLYTDPHAWKRALELQQRAATPHFKPSLTALLKAIDPLEEERESLPEAQKVLQKMLQHQAFDRLRYLSRWIEAKENRSN